MKRVLYSKLEEWKNAKTKKPLYLTGIRRCGKTWLAKEFGKSSYENYLYIDLQERKVQELFDEAHSPQSLLTRLHLFYGCSINTQQTLLIFDHLYAFPKAALLLGRFVEVQQAESCHVLIVDISYGAKLDERSVLNKENTDPLALTPLNFLEFLEAIGKENLVGYLDSLNSLQPLLSPFYQDLLENLNLYFHTGGLPEAIDCFLKSRDLKKVQAIQKEMLQQTLLDFFLSDSSLSFKARKIWVHLADFLQESNARFVYSKIDSNARKREYGKALKSLTEAKLAQPLYKLPWLDGQNLLPDTSSFKLYLCDIALLGLQAGLDQKVIKERFGRFHLNHGFLSENYLFLALLQNYPQRLFYWSQSKPKSEVEFLLCQDQQILPALLSFKHPGLTQLKRFKKLYPDQSMLSLCFGLENLRLDRENGILYIPLFLAEMTPKLISLALKELEKESGQS